MNALLHSLVAAARPFVTRSLRGTRRRYLLGSSVVIAVLVAITGLWVGQSSGMMARDIRESVNLETPRWERSETEFLVFVDDARELALVKSAQRLRQSHPDPSRWDPALYRAQEGWVLLDAVSQPHEVAPRGYRALKEQALQLRNARIDLVPAELESRRQYAHFDWDNPRDVRRLRAVVSAELNPTIVRYQSPLDGQQTIALIGTMAGGLLLLLLTIAAPLWAGVQLAQELHENTLQPLTGTALSARQLVIGLVAGACTPIAIVAAPLAVIALGASVFGGRVAPLVGMLGLSLTVGAMLTGLAMVLAYLRRGRQSPGIVGIGLLAILAFASFIGFGGGLNLSAHSLGAVTVLPGAGPAHLLAEAFFPTTHLSARDALALDGRLALVFVAAAVLTMVLGRALERLIDGTARDGALRINEAAVGATTIIALACATVPTDLGFGGFFMATGAIAAVPLQMLLAARAPGADLPQNLRTLPLKALLIEHTAWVGGLACAAFLVAGPPTSARWGMLIGLLYLSWGLLVLPLLSLRVAGPTTIGTKLWLGVCVVFTMINFGTAAVWLLKGGEPETLLSLGVISPALAAVQIVLLVWIPVSLLTALQPIVSPADRS